MLGTVSIAFEMTFEGAAALSLDVLNTIGGKEVQIVREANLGITSYQQQIEKAYWMRCEIVVLEAILKKIEECLRRMKLKRVMGISCKFSKTEIDVLVRNFPIRNGYGHIGIIEMYKHSSFGQETNKRLEYNGKTIIQP